jgi:hypothetical protein
MQLLLNSIQRELLATLEEVQAFQDGTAVGRQFSFGYQVFMSLVSRKAVCKH